MNGLAAALVEAQKNTTALRKDAKNQFHRYDYTSSEAIIDSCRNTLAAAGLTLSVEEWTFTEGRIEGVDGKPAVGRIHVTYRLEHTSGEHRLIKTSAFVVPEKGRPPDKAEFAAATENLGYTLRALLLVPRSNELAVSDRDDRPREPERHREPERRLEPAPAARQSEPRQSAGAAPSGAVITPSGGAAPATGLALEYIEAINAEAAKYDAGGTTAAEVESYLADVRRNVSGVLKKDELEPVIRAHNALLNHVRGKAAAK